MWFTLAFIIELYFRAELGTSASNGGTVNGRTDVRNIFDLQTENDYEDDQYNRPINPTGIFSAGGFGQRIFFRQNVTLLSQMENLGDSQAPGGFISEQDSKKL